VTDTVTSKVSPRDGATADAPSLADDLELLGHLAGSGYREAPGLVRRADGQTLQVTPLLYAVLEEIDGRRDADALASRLGERLGRDVTADDVAYLVEEKLRPLGVLCNPDGSQPATKRANPLLALRCRVVVSDPELTRRITRPFAALFRPVVVVTMTAAFAVITGWLLFDKGLASPARHLLYEPEMLLLVFALTLLSAGFHEFGHAAACRYGGATPGAMGVGLYLVRPAFYTDVTDSYRLGRGGRLRVDLGGLYFNALFAVAVFGLWALTRWDALLVTIPLQVVQMLHQLLPFVRLDGYHILADLTGVPDLFARIKPTLLGLLPTRWGQPESKVLKPWARAVVTLWVLAVIPVLALTFVLMAVALPRLVATAWDSVELQAAALRESYGEGALASAGVRLLSIVAIALPTASIVYLVVRVTRRIGRRLWRWTDHRPGRRAAALFATGAVVALLVSAWWPSGQYRPIQAYERGTLGEAVHAVSVSATSGGPVAVMPVAPGGELVTGTGAAAIEAAEGDAAVFPFSLPDAPRPQDNQALAVNTTDGAARYALAFELLMLSDRLADSTNEAYALASCTSCLTVAVAFQVVLLLGDVDTVTPENIAVAINYSCVLCVTYALALQLVITLDEPLSDDEVAELETIWEQVDALEEQLATMPLEEIQPALVDIEQQIVDVLADDIAGTETTESESDGTTESTTTTAGGEGEGEGDGDSTTTTTADGSGDTTTTTEAATTTTASP
jgi:putative peptide zinc metalloprotease protein